MEQDRSTAANSVSGSEAAVHHRTEFEAWQACKNLQKRLSDSNGPAVKVLPCETRSIKKFRQLHPGHLISPMLVRLYPGVEARTCLVTPAQGPADFKLRFRGLLSHQLLCDHPSENSR